MKIIILGAGQVGRTAAYHLAREEANEITVVDRDETLLRDLQDRHLLGIPEIDRLAEVAFHRQVDSPDQIADITETSRLFTVAENSQRFIIQGLSNEADDHDRSGHFDRPDSR